MFGNGDSNERGELRSPEQLLNVLREADSETLPTPEIAEQLPIGLRATQKRVSELEEEGRLVLAEDGRPKWWRLGDDESQEPVYRDEYARAKRMASRASDIGDKVLLVGISFLAAIGVVTTGNTYALLLNVQVLGFNDFEAVVTGGLLGVFAAGCFLGGFVAHSFSVALPPALKWYLEDTLPIEDLSKSSD